MKTIGYTTAFHRDCRRITKGLGADAVDEALRIIERLAAGETLPTRFEITGSADSGRIVASVTFDRISS